MQMPSWYDIYGLDIESKEDAEGIKKITRDIHALIDKQIDAGIAADKIVLAGFSQGGALSLYAGLRFSQRLSGLMGLSCYLPLRNQVETTTTSASRELPIFLAHGSLMMMLSLCLLQQLAKQILEEQGFTIEWYDYPCDHTVCTEEIQEIRNYLMRCWK